MVKSFLNFRYLYKIHRKVKNLKQKEYYQFTNENKNGKDQIVIPTPVFVSSQDEFSTQL